jgi:hypothetical protein
MAVYRIYENDTRASGDDVVFVRDGFTWSATIFGPLWLIRHGLWLWLIAYAALIALIIGGLRWAGASDGIAFVVLLLVAILIGLEASTLRHAGLRLRGYREAGVIVADDFDAAERRYFDRREAKPSSALPPAPPVPPAPKHDIIGLFPSPGATR